MTIEELLEGKSIEKVQYIEREYNGILKITFKDFKVEVVTAGFEDISWLEITAYDLSGKVIEKF